MSSSFTTILIEHYEKTFKNSTDPFEANKDIVEAMLGTFQVIFSNIFFFSNIFDISVGYSTHTSVSHGGLPAANVWSKKNLDGVRYSEHLVLVPCCPWIFVDINPPDVKV